MALLKERPAIRSMLQLLITYLVAWLAWLSAIAVAQLEVNVPVAVRASSNIPEVGLSWIGNLAIFVTSLLRGRLDLEIGARDVLATNRGPELKGINSSGLTIGLTTCTRRPVDGKEYGNADVVMLSSHKPSSCMKQFMKYVHHVHGLDSICLNFLPLGSAPVRAGGAGVCTCNIPENQSCQCIVFQTVEEIKAMLDLRMPGTLESLSDSWYLLPCSNCLRNGCHGCNLHVTENGAAESPAAVCEILHGIPSISEENSCICIPVRPSDSDDWTEMMIRFLSCKDKVDREFRLMPSDAMKNYIAHSGESSPVISQHFNISSFILPRLIEVLVNLVTTVWFKVDGFSSSLLARRAIRDYVVDRRGTGFTADAFVRIAWVKATKTSVCQRLCFRGSVLNVRNLSYIAGCVNLICTIIWVTIVAFEFDLRNRWYSVYSMPPSTTRVAVILVGIGVAFVMDMFNFLWLPRGNLRNKVMIVGAMVFEIGYVVALSLFFIKPQVIGPWVYSLLQTAVWVKWGSGSYVLGDRDGREEYDRLRHRGEMGGFISAPVSSVFSNGTYSSAFMLNAVLAVVRGEWTAVLGSQKIS